MPMLSRRERLRKSLESPNGPCVMSKDSPPAPDPKPCHMAAVELLQDEVHQWDDSMHARRGSFGQWRMTTCVVKERCFGGVGCLHVRFAAWCIAHDALPCTRETFETLLTDAGFLIADGLVSGLILAEDWQAAHWKTEAVRRELENDPSLHQEGASRTAHHLVWFRYR